MQADRGGRRMPREMPELIAGMALRRPPPRVVNGRDKWRVLVDLSGRFGQFIRPQSVGPRGSTGVFVVRSTAFEEDAISPDRHLPDNPTIHSPGGGNVAATFPGEPGSPTWDERYRSDRAGEQGLPESEAHRLPQEGFRHMGEQAGEVLHIRGTIHAHHDEVVALGHDVRVHLAGPLGRDQQVQPDAALPGDQCSGPGYSAFMTQTKKPK